MKNISNIALLVIILIIGVNGAYSQSMTKEQVMKVLSKNKYFPRVRNFERKQIVDSCLIAVTYKYTFVYDTANVQKYSEPMILEVGEELNRYYSYNSHIRDSVQCEIYLQGAQRRGHADGFLDITSQVILETETATYSDIFSYYKNRERTVSLRVENVEFQYEEEIDHLNWDMLPETDTVLGYLCNKAETEFRGRKWIAWFAMELPYNFGPWKLGGLPGLILKAEDSEGLFNWIAIGIEQPKNRSIYEYSEKAKSSYQSNSLLSEHIIKNCKREDVAKLWQRQWVASATMHLLSSDDHVIHKVYINSNEPVEKITINMGVLPDIYYPKLELDM